MPASAVPPTTQPPAFWKLAELRHTALHACALFTLSLIASAANWLRLGSFWGDPGRSLLELYRGALNQQPYVDFTWPYPPLSLWLVSFLLKKCGATFTAVQIIYDVLGFITILLFWLVCRQLFPPRRAFGLSVFFLLLTATNGGTFALFSLQLYTPAILVGCLGMLLTVLGVLRMLSSTILSVSSATLLLFGGLFSLLGKPECGAAAIAAVFIAMLCRPQRWRSWLAGGLILATPSLFVYAFLASRSGFRRVLEGLGGYGQATLTCPWWPTGFGLVGGLAALGEAGAILSLFVLLYQVVLTHRIPRLRRSLIALGVVGAGTWAAYSIAFFSDITGSFTFRNGVIAWLYYLAGTNTLLLPVMWVSCVVFACYLYRLGAHRRAPFAPREQAVFILAGMAAVISLRSLFGFLHSYHTQTVPAQFVILVPLAVLYIEDGIRRFSLPAAPDHLFEKGLSASLVLFAALYGAARLSGYVTKTSMSPSITLHTRAGKVILDDPKSAEAYQYLESRLWRGESFTDFAYGGGLNFALQSSSPLFSTQLTNFKFSGWHLAEDYQRLQRSQPRFLIGNGQKISGRFGMGDEFGCQCPRMVWKATGRVGQSDVRFPVADYANAHYRSVAAFDYITVFERSD